MLDDSNLEIFAESYERLEEHPDDVEYVDGETDAEDHLKALAYHREKLGDIDMHVMLEISKIEAWQDRETEKIRRNATYHEKSLESWLSRIKAKSVNLVHGKLQKVRGRLRVVVEDENQVPAEYQVQHLNFTVDKKSILKAHTDHGECVPGTEVVRGDDSCKITTNGP
tara:strand:+ start:1479 stop:1982 length:504 start_codon:yes stop_codon:yes gene_type:complete